MKGQQHQYPIKSMAKVLEVSRQGFHEWLKRPPSARAKRHEQLRVLIQEAHDLSRGTYGPLRLQDALPVRVGRDQISRLRKEMGLKCIQKKKYKATTSSAHKLPVAPNLLDQKFEVVEPGKVWGTDITYIWTDEGWLYLAAIKDFGSKEVLGYSMGARMTTDLVQEALVKALRYQRPQVGCIHHSDRGSQYCSIDYQREVVKAGLKPSMSRKGNCYDNAPTESLWSHLKQELVHHRRFATRTQARAAIQEWIEVFYNRMRRHSKLGNMAPAIYAENYRRERKTA
jgi:transposase InsO family protein